MKAVIMAGGEGRRLKAVTGELPKPMVPLLGKPLMERIIELLRDAGINHICATLRYNPRAITEYFGGGERLGVRLEYRVEREALGTAGGVGNCADFWDGQDFLVVSGDAACSFDLKKLIDEHDRHRPAVTMALYRSPAPTSYGLVVPDAQGRVRSFIEKPDWQRVVTDLVNTGIYVISPRAMDYVPRGRPFDFARDLFPLLLERGEAVRALVMEGYWCDVGTPRAYFQCCLDALERRLPLYDLPPEEAEAVETPAPEPPPGTEAAKRLFSCRDRARLMGAMSACLLELGADLSAGLRLGGERCGVLVRPDPRESALHIQAASGDPLFSKELADMTLRLAQELEEQ